VPANLQPPAGNVPYRVGHALGNQNYVCTAAGAWTLYGPDATLFDKANNEVITHLLSNNPFENATPPPPGTTWNPALGGNPRPTWQSVLDTGTIWVNNTLSPSGPAQASTDPNYVASGAISWLLLPVVCGSNFPCGGALPGPSGGTKLTQTTYVQRVNTSGGCMPSAGPEVPGCSASSACTAGAKFLAPYTADYYFYKAQ
jgi:hypothetical protein